MTSSSSRHLRHRFTAPVALVLASLAVGGTACGSPSPAGDDRPPPPRGSETASVPAGTSPGQVPLREGLMIVTALSSDERGDRESIKTVAAVRPDAVVVTFVSRRDGGDIEVSREVRRSDLESAHYYRAAFSTDDDELIPGTTALGVSTAVLDELKTKGRTTLECRMVVEGDVAEMRGVLERVGTGTVTFPVFVNDQRVELRALRAAGTMSRMKAEFLFLDDPQNPLTLQARVDNEKLDVVRITYPAGTPRGESRLERELTESRRTVVYGIYFDFASDRIRSESEPVLAEIADILRRNPEWALAVEGHTDNIGDDDDNQDLSERRAQAVEDALGDRRIDGRRLTTAGFGESRPQDTNDTVQGRARNRRVELVRR